MSKKNFKHNKKAAIQLSMSFLVMLVMAITIFILSLVFLGDFFDQSVQLKTNLDQQTRAQIQNMLRGNERVAIPLDTKRVKRGEPASYGVGIRNTLSNEYFRVILTGSAFIPIESPEISHPISCSLNFETGNNICTINNYEGQNYESSNINQNIQYLIGRDGKLNIQMNNEDISIIALQSGPRSPRGHYIFDVYVCADQTNYPTSCTSSNRYGDGVYKIHFIVT